EPDKDGITTAIRIEAKNCATASDSADVTCSVHWAVRALDQRRRLEAVGGIGAEVMSHHEVAAIVIEVEDEAFLESPSCGTCPIELSVRPLQQAGGRRSPIVGSAREMMDDAEVVAVFIHAEDGAHI